MNIAQLLRESGVPFPSPVNMEDCSRRELLHRITPILTEVGVETDPCWEFPRYIQMNKKDMVLSDQDVERLMVAYEFGRRAVLRKHLGDGTKLETSIQVGKMAQMLLESKREETLMAFMMDNQLNLIAVEEISVGAWTEAIFDPRVILHRMLLARAESLILAHNHPSGSLTASLEDIRSTQRIKTACKYCGFALIDHIIVGGHGGIYSMRASCDWPTKEDL